MKKTITFLTLAFTFGVAQAQTVTDFESFTLTPNSFYKDTNSVAFQSSSAVFRYSWDTSFDYWSGGTSYTNKYDSVSTSNLYGVRAYKGYNNSAMYAVCQDRAIIKLKPGFNTVDGFYVTNTTFAWKSMKLGDSFAKKFGGVTGSDPDYFGITVKGYLNGAVKSDTVNFYLADFRSSTSSQDYILNTWDYVNTASLGQVDSVRIFMFSSDIGTFGINTPLFFGMDNFTTSNVVYTGMAEQPSPLHASAYPNPFNSTLHISLQNAAEKTKVQISDVTGKLVHEAILDQQQNTLSLEGLQSGIYFMELRNGEQKSVTKLIKN